MNSFDDFLCQPQCEDFEPFIEEYYGIFAARHPFDYEGENEHG